MLCRNCGSDLPDKARFCFYCGKKTTEEVKTKKICPECKMEYENDRVFCMKCGMRLVEASGQQAIAQSVGGNESGINSAKKTTVKANPAAYTAVSAMEETADNNTSGMSEDKIAPEKEILTLNSVTYYEGEPTATYRSQLGKLTIYNDKLLFKSVFENHLFAPIRGLSALGKTMVFPIDQIRQVREGRYLWVYHSLVIDMKNGRTHSFVPAVPGPSAAIQGALMAVKQLL